MKTLRLNELIRPIAYIAILLTAISLGGCASNGLVEMNIKQEATRHGKPIEIEFREIQREENASIVEVKHSAGSSVASSMFIMRGVCNVVSARGAKYFSSQQIFGTFGGNARYKVSFHERADEMAEVDNDPYGLTKRLARVQSSKSCLLLFLL
jgi:membrane-bound inhibitor of C-type lysozyme